MPSGECYMASLMIVSIGSGNGLLPSGNKALLEPMLTQIMSLYGITRSQWVTKTWFWLISDAFWAALDSIRFEQWITFVSIIASLTQFISSLAIPDPTFIYILLTPSIAYPSSSILIWLSWVQGGEGVIMQVFSSHGYKSSFDSWIDRSGYCSHQCRFFVNGAAAI